MTPARAERAPVLRRLPPAWAFVSAAWLGPAFLAAFQAYVRGRLGGDELAWGAILWEGGDWLLCALLTPLVFLAARRFPPERARLARSVLVHLGAALLLCVAWAGGGVLLRWALVEGPPSLGGVVGWFFTSLPFSLAVYGAVLGVERAATFFLEAREREVQATRLAAQLSEARLGALKMQMQPHFLLNSLNAITVVVRDRDTATATRMLEHLGELLRRVVRTDRPAEVPLAEELDFVRQHLALEELRFSDRLRPAFALEPGLEDAAVPEFILQPLVENALRHGLERRSAATKLEIAARREGEELVLSVTDDGPGAGLEQRRGLGLTNARERLRTLYGERARLELAPASGGGTVATIRLPYRALGPGAGGGRG